MTDQRADTPRTAAGRALLEELGVTYPEQDWWLHYILAIEAEAAAEPAAAETPDVCECGNGCLMPHQHYDAAAYRERAAQPPRGRPSEKWVADQVGEPGMYEDGAGSSLTATEPPTDEKRAEFKRGEYEAMRAIVAGDLICPDPSIHESGSPRGVTPALDQPAASIDVERLEDAYDKVMGIGAGIRQVQWDRIAAEYARLGSLSLQESPEDMTAAERNALIEKLAEDGSL